MQVLICSFSESAIGEIPSESHRERRWFLKATKRRDGSDHRRSHPPAGERLGRSQVERRHPIATLQLLDEALSLERACQEDIARGAGDLSPSFLNFRSLSFSLSLSRERLIIKKGNN